jgi:dimethylglycine catabolism B
MKRPRALALLEDRRAELETCTYCPKLCRAACPVSNAEASDTVTPWGKMSGSHTVARGDAPATAEYAKLPWACTGCFACRERCDHRNEVAPTLYDARAAFVARGVAPEGSERSRRGFPERSERVRARVESTARAHDLSSQAPVAFLLGCQYALGFPEVVRDAIAAARELFGPLRLVSECCGYSLDAAGDPEGANAARAKLLKQTNGAHRVIALDAGCAYALAPYGAESFARAAEDALGGGAVEAPFGDEALRYHDSCLLGRGLGEYDAPRALVGRASHGGVQEFFWRREHARCSGGGGLLPLTRPSTSESIARTRLEEHERLGGGTIVTACAQSLRRFSASGAKVLDLASVVARLTGS